MPATKPLYNRLKICLAIKRISNKDLAKQLDVSEQTVSKWCTNAGQPSVVQLYAIAKYLNMPVPDLLEPIENLEL